MSLKVAVIGVGNLGQYHLKEYKNIDDVVVIGAVDVDEKRGHEIAEKYDVPYYGDYHDIIDKVDAVSIVVPTIYHYEIAKEFIDAGKDILLEKPITETVDQAERLVELAKEKNVILQVGHIERFNAAFLAAEPYIKDVRFIESHRLAPIKLRSLDVAVVLDLMIHDIDIILHIVKSKIADIKAVGVPVLLENSVDIANVRIEFENGCVANITASRVSQKSMRKLRIFQKDAYISVDFQNMEADVIKRPPMLTDEMIKMGSTLDKNILDEMVNNFIKNSKLNINKILPLGPELNSFIDSVKNRTVPKVSGEDGLRSLKIAEQIMQQIKYRLKDVR